jgi:hypothetical protein
MEASMSNPSIHPIVQPLARIRPELVRAIARSHGFTPYPKRRLTAELYKPGGNPQTEIWYKRVDETGYATIRLDTQGHSSKGISPGPHGGVPHYHKEWIAAEYFDQYVQHPVSQTVSYLDDGMPDLSRPRSDQRAANVHIKR